MYKDAFSYICAYVFTPFQHKHKHMRTHMHTFLSASSLNCISAKVLYVCACVKTLICVSIYIYILYSSLLYYTIHHRTILYYTTLYYTKHTYVHTCTHTYIQTYVYIFSLINLHLPHIGCINFRKTWQSQPVEPDKSLTGHSIY